MSVMLELYLEELKQQLKPLPAQQRESELREIESHLHAMIEANQADGMLYGDAVVAAIRQFGCPNRVGRDLSRAWQKRQSEHPLRALAAGLGAMACQAACLQIYTWVMPVIAGLLRSGNHAQPYTPVMDALLSGMNYSIVLTPIASGMVAQAIAPRRGWWASLTVYLGVIDSMFILVCLFSPRYTEALQLWPLFLLLPSTLFGSWWGKRRRLRQEARKSPPMITTG